MERTLTALQGIAHRVGPEKGTLRWRGEGPWDLAFTRGVRDVTGTAEVLPGDILEDLVHGIMGL